MELLNICNKPVVLTLDYGVNTVIGGKPYNHKGMDFAPRGIGDHIILSATNGIVDKIAYDKGFGWYVRIKISGTEWLYYCHLKNKATYVVEGQKVKTGDKLGVMGSTGHSTGTHLHFEYRSPNTLPKNHKNPSKFIKKQNMDNENLKITYEDTKKKWSPLFDSYTQEQFLEWFKKEGKPLLKSKALGIDSDTYRSDMLGWYVANKDFFGKYWVVVLP